MSEMCNTGENNKLSIRELLKKTAGVEVFDAPFPNRNNFEFVVVRPTGRLFGHAFLLCSRGATGSVRVHFELGDERSCSCYSSTCVCCISGYLFKDPIRQKYEEDEYRKYLGLQPVVHERDVEVANHEWHEVMLAKLAENLVKFCGEKDIEVLFMRRAELLKGRISGFSAVESESSLEFLLSRYSAEQVARGFHFIRSVGYCYTYWREELNKRR